MRRLLFLALALLTAAPAMAQEAVDAQIARDADSLTPNTARKYAKTRNGNPQVAGSLQLADPIADGGRVIDRVDVMQEWDCKAGRYRITRKTLRTSDGLYVTSDPRDGPWIAVAATGPGAQSLRRVCPGRTTSVGVTTTLPTGEQVITFP